MTVYSVSQINGYIKGMLDEDVLLQALFIEGEVSNFKRHSSGHLYFSLKDERAAMSAVMFRGEAAGLGFRPENGMKVVACGRVSAYEKAGTYQLYVEMMEPAGLGGLYLAFRQLKEKLEAEGLFDPSRKRAVPETVSVIGVVTSIDGAAFRDIVTVAGRRDPGVRIILAPAAVQGEGAAAEIARGIEALNSQGLADVIIVGRGGGSMEDLWAFNEEAAARAVAGSLIPVVSAVGHETDFTICDFTADLRAATPSAAAEICVPDRREKAERLYMLVNRLNGYMSGNIDNYTSRLYNIADSFPGADDITERVKTRLTASARRISREMQHRLETAEARAGAVIQSLHQAAPSNVLKRGFAMVSVNGKVIKTAGEAVGSEGFMMRTQFNDGVVHGEIKKVD
ncbi:MAG: exodeoxyribonuclease VII large subunit [Clostridiales bacterium]|jgi:exodeoxyribonuclease VII large subunit|nr:exodeoxyribonuclease VII large subunit [Clostridiales bacterium]